jgi:hypothetical protein
MRLHRHLAARRIFSFPLEGSLMKVGPKSAPCRREKRVRRTGCGIAGVRFATTFGGTSAQRGVSISAIRAGVSTSE